jgi:hypothetical protein
MSIVTTSSIKSLIRPGLAVPKEKIKLPKKPIKKQN